MRNSGRWSVISGRIAGAYRCAPLFFFLVLTAVGIFLGCDRSGETAYKEGERLWEEGKYAEALVQYEKVVSKDPKGRLAAEAMYQMGNIYTLNLKDYRKAVDCYKKVVEANPKTPFARDAQKKMAEIYRDKYGDLSGAISEYQRFANLYPREADRAIFDMGQCRIILMEFDKAREGFERILKEFPEIDYKDEVRYQTANSYYLEGKTDEAKKGFEELIKEFPGSRFAPDAKFGIALAYEEAGELQQALDRLSELKGVYPNQMALELRIAGIKERMEARKRPVQAKVQKLKGSKVKAK